MLLTTLAIEMAPGLHRGVTKGRDSMTWPSVKGYASSASQRRDVHRFLPETHTLFLPYRYQIDGEWYHQSHFDIVGGFRGSLFETKEARKNYGGEIVVHYNPEDPGEAVLAPGIVFDSWTRSLFRMEGALVLLLALIFIQFRGPHNSSNSKQSLPPPLPRASNFDEIKIN